MNAFHLEFLFVTVLPFLSFTIDGSKDVGSKPVIYKLEPEDGGLRLKCTSTGWYPKPEMVWLDSEGRNLTSESGHRPTFKYTIVEGLYTVIGDVVVRRRQINRFVCRIHLQQNNHTTETEISIPGHMFPAGFVVDKALCLASLILAVGICLFCLRNDKIELLRKQMAFVNKSKYPKFKDVRQYRGPITLDPDTAQSFLQVDGNHVRHLHRVDLDVGVPSPRFEVEPCVLGKEEISQKYYFVVEMEGSWIVGVARKSINKERKIKYGHDAWTLSRRKGKIGVYVKTYVPLNLKLKLKRVGVYVDYKESLVSFYNVTTKEPWHIYSYTKCNFSGEPLRPFFRTWGSRSNVLTIINADDGSEQGSYVETSGEEALSLSRNKR